MIEAAHSNAGDEDDQPSAQGILAGNIGLLKGAVYTMGVMLVVGTIVLIAGIIWKASRLPPGTAAPSQGPAQRFEALDIPVPAGTAVGSVALDGNRMAVTLDGAPEIVIIDLSRGEVVGRIRLTPEAPSGGGAAASR